MMYGDRDVSLYVISVMYTLYRISPLSLPSILCLEIDR